MSLVSNFLKFLQFSRPYYMPYNIWYEQFIMNCFSDSMESASKKNHRQSFLIFMCMHWVPIVNLHSSLAIILQQMDWRRKYLIWTLVNGIKQTIILFQMVIGKHLNLKLVNKQVNIKNYKLCNNSYRGKRLHYRRFEWSTNKSFNDCSIWRWYLDKCGKFEPSSTFAWSNHCRSWV